MNIRYYFGFTKNQNKGLIVFLALNLAVIGYYFIDDYLYQGKPPHDFSKLITHLDSLEASYPVSFSDSLYDFDPNTIDADVFTELGLNKAVSERIVKYRQKGGHFYKRSDLMKIYGMDSSWYNKVEPFIKIIKDEAVSIEKTELLRPFQFNPNTVVLSDLLQMGLSERSAKSWIKYLDSGGRFGTCIELSKLYLLDSSDVLVLLPFCELETDEVEEQLSIDINSADSIELLKIKGVGPAYAHRILQYRSSLGGFVSLLQLKEVYGVDSVKYFELEPQLEIGYMQMEWVYINQDDFKLLLKHPYLSYQQVKSVVNYRNELGDLNSLSELLQLEGFGAKDTARLKPYINFQTN